MQSPIQEHVPQGLAKEMGSSSFTELSVPLSGLAAYFMSQNCGPRGSRHLEKWQTLIKNNLKLQMATMENVPVRYDYVLKKHM